MKDILERIISDNFTNQSFRKYYNEAQIQYKIGIEIYKEIGTEPIFEYKVSNNENNQKEYIDLFVDHNGKTGIEIKYKTKKIENEDYVNQGAQNNGKYDFIKDVFRLEKFKEKEIIDRGYSILITNDSSYWTNARSNSLVKNFDLISNTATKNMYQPQWKDRNRIIELEHNYLINWTITGTFNYLIIEI